MKILPRTNELLRAAESALNNEERYYAWQQRKSLYEAQRATERYLNKELHPDSSEPEWWTYENNDSEWIKQQTGENE